jgi:hypothetical protein
MLHQLARFSAIAPLIRELGAGTALDVGSGSEGVAGWLGPGWEVTAVDRSFEDAVAPPGPHGGSSRRVTGDVRELPFGDGAFDVVLALDVLEHVPPADRARALREVVRAARRRVIVACPTGGAALAADRRLAAGLRARGMAPPEWLVEHERFGFPDTADLRALADGRGTLRLLANENVRWHEWLFRLEFRRPGFHLSRAASRAIAAGLVRGGPVGAASRAAVRAVQGPARPPAYRTIAVLDLRGSDPAP